jgi:hypothetical protein
MNAENAQAEAEFAASQLSDVLELLEELTPDEEEH